MGKFGTITPEIEDEDGGSSLQDRRGSVFEMPGVIAEKGGVIIFEIPRDANDGDGPGGIVSAERADNPWMTTDVGTVYDTDASEGYGYDPGEMREESGGSDSYVFDNHDNLIVDLIDGKTTSYNDIQLTDGSCTFPVFNLDFETEKNLEENYYNPYVSPEQRSATSNTTTQNMPAPPLTNTQATEETTVKKEEEPVSNLQLGSRKILDVIVSVREKAVEKTDLLKPLDLWSFSNTENSQEEDDYDYFVENVKPTDVFRAEEMIDIENNVISPVIETEELLNIKVDIALPDATVNLFNLF